MYCSWLESWGTCVGVRGGRRGRGEGKGGKRNTYMLHKDNNAYDSLSPINMKSVYSFYNILMVCSIELNEVVILVNPICFLMLFHESWSIKWLSGIYKIWILKFNSKFEHGSNSCEMCKNHPFYFGIHQIDGNIELFIWKYKYKNFLPVFMNSLIAYIWLNRS